MYLKNWQDLPQEMQNAQVRKYYELLASKKSELFLKSMFDKIAAVLMLIALSPIFVALTVWIKLDSPGEVFFRQERVTQYGRRFRIHKFRTMVKNAEQCGTQVTTVNDSRITKSGRLLRKCRLDELPQLIDIINGDMSFVGTRPEVPKYVAHYTPEMWATLLMPAGVTSEASIAYKDEDELLGNAVNVDECYIREVLPQKMKWNLESMEKFSFLRDIITMIKTVRAVI